MFAFIDSKECDVKTLNEKSKVLFLCLKDRMKAFHLKRHHDSSHWVWTYAMRNLSRTCSIITLLGWVKDDISRYTGQSRRCLIMAPSNNSIAVCLFADK